MDIQYTRIDCTITKQAWKNCVSHIYSVSLVDVCFPVQTLISFNQAILSSCAIFGYLLNCEFKFTVVRPAGKQFKILGTNCSLGSDTKSVYHWTSTLYLS
jgi:hypothetical protein